VTLSVPNIHISGDRSELLFTHEEALSWFVSLQEEYEASVDQLGNCSLNIAFFTKTKMQDMNKKFAGKDSPTNVLSFPSNEDIKGVRFLGDIAICSELIKDEATAQGKNVQHHLMHIFIHGVLHLLGFDHAEQSSAEQMEALEVRVLKKLGVADPY
jgi:probable rRNA maturation factor|tara:strand:- start:959 stop:1426 length:468 start_codon:yes stop_codon:yes gene_type:complete